MIVRFWRGWTTAANADGYEELIRSTIFPHILDEGSTGCFVWTSIAVQARSKPSS
jgi:hypothetical protein